MGLSPSRRGAAYHRHLGLLVDLGEMQILARRGGCSTHLVQPSGSGMFATNGVVADQTPKAHAGKKHRHVGTVQPPPSLHTVEALSSTPSLPSVEALSSSPSLQHVLEDSPRVLNRSKVLPKP